MLEAAGLTVHPALYQFIVDELLPRLDMDEHAFWNRVASIIEELTPLNRQLLAFRDETQERIDAWHDANPGQPDPDAYRSFLTDIGYLVPPGEPFQIGTRNVDPEIAEVAGPQLVVPVSNARFAINAANARWGSLYDALYGSDVIDEADGKERGTAYNEVRGQEVIAEAMAFLDRTLPLHGASHSDVERYQLTPDSSGLMIRLKDGGETALENDDQFVGSIATGTSRRYLFVNHGLHIEVQTDAEHAVGCKAPGNVADVILEAAITTIQDCEDSVAAVDAHDKVGVYRNWLGLMTHELTAEFRKAGTRRVRALADDRDYIARDGSRISLPGRSLMLVRNVGHLMTTDAILDSNGDEVFEGILDAIVTTGCALVNHDQQRRGANSRSGSIYIVKPKMHGPDEAALTNTLFARVEDLYGIARYTIKVGVMDEERRTTVNLPECIRAVKHRVAFINTGFLDRTGDEIHTSMRAGPVLPKEMIKAQPWINAYEDWNVDIGIRCGLPGRAQIGKGMWPKPDEMKQMMDTKQAHPEAGANCAWVPSPTAATLHAMHYHAVDVRKVQQDLASRPLASLDDILTPPLGDPALLDEKTIRDELDNNAQGILGYVVRWIDHGVGCSKVPDISDVGLMEDRATLRISSQHIANWLLHGVTSEEQVMATMKRMAVVVDDQNTGVPNYLRMSDDYEGSVAFKAACDLIFKGCEQPNGYTEPLLHAHRRELKALS